MDSLHPPCTSLKVKYDSCWNHWFSEYLHLAAPRDDPKLSKITSSDSSKDSSQRQKEQEERQQKIRVKAQEYEDKCGDVWRAYRTCLNDGLDQKELRPLIAEARAEFPLKEPKEVDMHP